MSTALIADSDRDDLIDPDVPTPEYSLLARLGAEVFGTFVLVLVGVGIALFATINSVSAGIGIPLGFGIAVLGAASAVGHISGGHFNPAVSLGGAIAGRISWSDLLPYWLAQLVGGTAASALLFALVPSGLPAILGFDNARTMFSGTSNGFGEHSPVYGLLTQNSIDATTATGASFGLLGALLVEVVATAVFVGVILGVTDKRANISFAPAAIGLTLALLITLAAPVTNASLNPARSTATAVFSNGWAIGQLWLFWVAPLLGAAIAALIYRIVTPAAGAEGEWPEQEPTAELAEAVEAEEFEGGRDEIDALLARQAALGAAGGVTAAAALPEVEPTESLDPAALDPAALAAETEAETEVAQALEGDGDSEAEPKA